MFKTKLEVDKHVDNSLKKINNETERNLRCFSFAKLYFNVGDYEQARRYASSYISVKTKSAEGFQLLGKSLEKLGKKEAALEAYRQSLQINSTQNNLVIKVCELLASDDVNMDKSGARYFCDLAQQFDPHNPAVFSLKERLITIGNDNPSDVSQLLLKELENRPLDVNLRVKLLKHFLQHNMLKEALKHATDIEEQNLEMFHRNLSWYEAFAEVLMRYQRDLSYSNTLNWEFWFMFVAVLDRKVSLSLDEHSDTPRPSQEYISAVFDFDQVLTKAVKNVEGCPDRQLVLVFLNHYHAQLYFHFATMAFKQAKEDLLPYKEAANLTLPVLLAAYHSQPPDLQSVWLNHTTEPRRRMVQRWHKEASFRCSQAGHILLSAAKDRKSIVIEKATQYSTGIWREQFYKKLFVKRDQQQKMPSSFFVSGTQPLEPIIKLPEISELLKYDEVAQMVYPDSLHHYIWMFLNSNLASISLMSFEGLQYSVKNLNSCAAESLSLLDVQAFIYSATLCAQSKLDDPKPIMYFNQDKPSVIPVAVTDTLGTLNQAKFLMAAHKMYKNEHSSNMGELRLLLIRGIEVVRCVGQHGLDVKLLVMLANIFADRAKNATKQSEVEFNDARAELYWKTALPLLERLKNNQIISFATNRLFEYKSKEMPLAEVALHIEKGKLFTAVQLMKKKDYEKALAMFKGLKDPYASFYESQIYKHMADQKTSQNRENVTSEMRSQNIIFLSRARDALYLTLDRLRDPSVDRGHPLNMQLGSEIEKMERLLSRIDPDCSNRNECDGMSDENVSTDSADHYLTSYTTHNASFHNNGGGFTPKHDPHPNHTTTPYRFDVTRREARPSPERLDAQIRQMVASKDVALNNILEQNRMMVESHRSLLDELRSFKDAVNNLTSTVEDLKTIKHGFEELKQVKKSVDELKSSVDDLQTIVDVVQDMKKEISELKKDANKNSQLSEEDLYVLDPDYGVDYAMNSNLGAGYNPNLYPNYPGRMTNPPPYPPTGLYPGLYPAAMAAYAYGGLGLPPAFVPEQLPTIPSQSNFAPSSSLGINMLTGQNLTQGLAQSNIIKETPKASLSTLTQTTQSLFPSMTTTSLASTSRAPPVNVVITSSDPLPAPNKPQIPQPILSVTIPPQHLKGNLPPKPQLPHNYQIPLSSSGMAVLNATPSILSKPPPAVCTQSLLSNIAPPLFSAVTQSKTPPRNVTLGLQIEKTLDQTFSPLKNNTSLNTTNSSLEEYDPCPDFKPIVPLPDEVPANTGEELETVLFSERAKLFRYVDQNGVKEWKERGVGVLKILLNPTNSKIRVLMRRDQVFKICANHFLTSDMQLKNMNERAYIWAANDFADEQVVLETFCVRFKTPEEAKLFYDAFESAKKRLANLKNKSKQPEETKGVSLGGFTFSSTPTFKPKDGALPVKQAEVAESAKVSPFSSFTFGSGKFKPITSQDTPQQSFSFQSPISSKVSPVKLAEEEAEDFVPTAEFKPVVTLPDLVEVKTGEENAEVLLEYRAKLFRWDANGENKEWKERGVGNIKILKEDSIIRLVMRREQVHKVCLNHQVLKNMTFKQNENNPKAILWHAQDFSEGVLKPEMFMVRFKTEEQATGFLKVLSTAQTSLDETNSVTSKHHKAEASPKNSFGDKFKPAKGSWECKNCYIVNEGKDSQCVACETAKSGAVKKIEEEASGPLFSFGAPASGSKPTSGFLFGQKSNANVTLISNWGSAFKPAEGSWECQVCFVRNTAEKSKCASCETGKDGTVVTQSKGINLETPGQSFSFGLPKDAEIVTTPKAVSLETKQNFSFGFGDAFKPKVDSWECSSCLVRNNSDKTRCASCDASKDGKTTPKAVSLETPGQSFSFDISGGSGFGDAFKPKADSWECKTCYIRNNSTDLYCVSCETPKDDTVPKKEPKAVDLSAPKFAFGLPMAGDTKNFAFGFNTQQPQQSSPFSFASKPPQQEESKYVFGSPQKHNFEFTPRSPRRISSGQGDEESDGSYVEDEGDNIYFKPVIPLPEKVEVKTGEEQEEVLYCHRAKLFRFVGGEWKERGLGDIKLLKRIDNGKLRIVMRREQILKICLNHVLTPDIEYIPKDEKTWLFYAADYSEGEISHEQFCLRFKNADVAQEFKQAVKNALNSSDTNSGSVGEIQSSATNAESSDDDGLEIVYETQVTPAEEQEAIRLLLPPKFMSYRQLPDCTCDQCKKDDEYYNEPPKKSESNLCGTTGMPLTFGFTPASKMVGQESLRELLQKPQVKPELSKSFSFAAAAQKPSVFESASGSPSEKPACVFGGKFFGGSDAPATPVFGGAKTTGIFGAGGSIFGGGTSTTTTSSIFASPSTPTSKSIFGGASTTGSVFGGSANVGGETGGLFGATAPVFGGSTNIFGAKDEKSKTEGGIGFSFAALASKPTTTALKDDDEVVLKCDSGLSFASLAAGTKPDEPPAFAKNTTAETTTTPFAFLGAGAPVFGGAKDSKKSADKSKTESDNEGEAHGEEEYDPHYEPIVPLPAAIEVSTGEEEETVLFKERAKLYRYTNKEWKERGVGDLKILHHPGNNTYRLLLRREQVHKVVLNQLIIPDLELQPMSTSDTAWVWAGYNYTEDEAALEKLAVRFKNVGLAHQFHSTIQDVIGKVTEIQNSKTLPVGVENYVASHVEAEHDYGHTDDDDDEGDEYHDTDDDYGDGGDEDEPAALMFDKRCVLSEQSENDSWKTVTEHGNLRMVCDSDGVQVSVVDDSGLQHSSTIIGSNTLMDIQGNACIWKAVEYIGSEIDWRTLKAVFETEEEANEFHSSYLEGLNYAEELEIVDELPDGHDA